MNRIKESNNFNENGKMHPKIDINQNTFLDIIPSIHIFFFFGV